MRDGILLRNLSFGYGNSRKIIENLYFTADYGEKIFVRGCVGSGKTTLFKIISGLIPVFYNCRISGDVMVFGENSPANFRKHVYLVPQNPEEQIIFEDVEDEIFSVSHDLNLVKRFNADHLISKKTSELSDGEKQLVTLITAFASKRECIILDEPFSHLHPKRVEKLIDYVLSYRGTIIFSDKRYDFLKRFSRVVRVGGVDCDYGCEPQMEIWNTEIGEKVLEVRDLSFAYGSKTILNSINLDLRRGEAISIVGDNGSGKTTLLKAISGILKADGVIVRKGRISLSLQYPNYSFTERTVAEELSFSKDILKTIMGSGILTEELLPKHPHSLSAGESKLVSVLKALKGDIVLLDEPTVAQNYEFGMRIIGLIKKLGKSAIIATHDFRLAEMADVVYELKGGELKLKP
ncbi:ATPase component of various ABC-type transport systems, containing duplicated ATPase [Archaeoglobus sulfaticallidus PM70-1]|uniref:ATPase component of various ABC-type transport systems, containing duplicated ATPase n=1 Tax=Archaeoglobus sulfaticallidus PM70-1 TaxID=387631 RepID=N0BCD1_9EURY|nr:ABC transporter ATP-binding protein [Archaeoglobus sulfaticallidus]AGK61274.1 ATPase component of various ABC-type transport systems, containing duplicated ATPase [Archaeoglobus sulfaticallidus PM70-1]